MEHETASPPAAREECDARLHLPATAPGRPTPVVDARRATVARAAAGVVTLLLALVATGVPTTAAHGEEASPVPASPLPDPGEPIPGDKVHVLDPIGDLAGGDEGDDQGDPTPQDGGGQGPTPAGPGPSEPGVAAPPPTQTGGDGAVEEDFPSFEAPLDLTRDLSGIFRSPTIDVAAVPPAPSPYLDYVDVPLGPRTTRDVVDALVAAGASDDDVRRILAPFPVVGLATYTNDWGAPRHAPTFHAHEGTDIFASRGTPVVASIGGRVTRVAVDTAVGGNAVYVTDRDGEYLYYAHLDGFAPAAVEGAYVDVGTVLGYVGDSGNARGGAPHLHFEVHLPGGEPIPPLPYLDSWLAQAREEARVFGRTADAALSGPFRGQVAKMPTPLFFDPSAETSTSPVKVALALLVLALPVIGWRFRRSLAPLTRHFEEARQRRFDRVSSNDVLAPYLVAPPRPPQELPARENGHSEVRELVGVGASEPSPS